MPTFRWPVRGSRVITAGSVMNGAASPGQQVCTGRSARSTSSPRRTTSWHAPLRTLVGLESAIDFSCLSPRSLSASPDGGCISSTPASFAPMSSRRSTPNARHIRRSVPNWLISNGCLLPFGRSKRRAGPPDLTARSTISVISRYGSTSTPTRTSSPSRSSSSIHSRRSASGISAVQERRVLDERAHPLDERAHDLELHAGVRAEQLLEVALRQDERAQRRLRGRRHLARLADDERELADEVARADRLHAPALLRHLDLAVDDREELTAHRPLACKRPAGGEVEVLRDLRELRELALRQSGEQRHALERFDLRVLCEQLHAASVLVRTNAVLTVAAAMPCPLRQLAEQDDRQEDEARDQHDRDHVQALLGVGRRTRDEADHGATLT